MSSDDNNDNADDEWMNGEDGKMDEDFFSNKQNYLRIDKDKKYSILLLLRLLCYHKMNLI